MNLFRRINAILTANFNDLIDRFEDPRKMLEQAIRDMEDTIQSAMESAARVLASEKLLERQIASREASSTTWQSRAEHAARQSDDELARTALVRKHEQDALAEALRDQRNEARESGAKLKRQIEAMHVRLGEARRRLSSLVARNEAAKSRRQFADDFGGLDQSAHAFSLFDRMEARIDRTEAEADAFLELATGSSGIFDGDTTLNDESIEAELTALKESVAGAE